MIRFILSTVAFFVVAVHTGLSDADEYDAPFVSGFDRFYRVAESLSDTVVGGRLLLSELSCTACHATADPALAPKLGPNLAAAGKRYQPDWWRRYLADPQAVKPGTTMPDVMHRLDAAQKRQAADAIAAFLSTQETNDPVLVSTASNPIAEEFWRKGDHHRGAELYHSIGCVACHAPNEDYATTAYQGSSLEKLLQQLDPDEIEELGLTSEVRPVRSVPHGDLAGKYSLKSLAFFLLAPQRTRPNGRMPSLNLKPDEAADITAYLIGSQANVGQGAVKIDPSLVERGRRFFTELQCVQCHTVDALKGAMIAQPLVDLNPVAARSCAGKRRDEVPHYKLDPAQLKSIQAALAAIGDESGPAESPLQTQMLKLNCYACHNRNRRGGVGPKRRRYFETVGHVDIGDEGRLPPPLDHVGRKLKRNALEDALKGTISVRPHMFVRMPQFAASSVASLASELIKADAGNEPAVKTDMVDDPKLASDGRLLFDTGCVQCHPVRGEHLPGVVGIDLAGVDQRIRPQWFHEFLLNPAALKTRTRMPTFFPDGRGADPNMLDGDADRQIAALWAYIRDIEKHPLPQKILDGKAHDFELIPDKRPLLIRTFMKEAGTHAIAVGFGQKVHFALDAEAVRPAQAWRGQFLDAHGTWFDRFTPLATPLGEDVVGFPPGVPFALLPSRKARWPAVGEAAIRFGGFRLDSSGVPTFLYRMGPLEIEDRIAPDEHAGLHRSIRVKQSDLPIANGAELWFRGNAGESLRRENSRSYTNHSELTVTVSEPPASAGIVREFDGAQEWIIPIATESETRLEVNYRW